MEQDFGSECSSGCESGWTLYLEQSMHPSHSIRNDNVNVNVNVNYFSCKKTSFTYEKEDDEEEEDMSTISDASSGPPNFQQQQQQQHDDQCFNNNNNKNRSNEKGQKIPKDVNLPSFLDDTASSPLFNFSNVSFYLHNN